ncbi:MAG TPA: serine hydrolase [Mycobacteriales bacterium]|jgi:D-alanyl-D-alanine carboxypeptidase (penicillin-binding protein 5/6)|nr:serine hydrolase [Mycobacteriales bacterium]
MPTPPRARLLARALLVALLVVLVALGLAPAAPARADTPLGGPRLQGLDVVSDSPGTPPVPPTSAASFLVADLDSGDVLAAKDPHGRYAPASTLKTLTAVALLPRLDLAQQVAPAADDVNVDGTKVGLVRQLSYSVRDLFTALMVTSANDAAGALATAVGGQQAAARLMNAEAVRLNALDTHAENTSGLDAVGQVSSAYDLALISRAGLTLPDFRTFVATRRAFIPAPGGVTIEINNHNRLLSTYAGTLGVKNGYTDAARASFIGAATRGGRTLVVTLMRGEPAIWKDAAALLDWGFAATGAGARPVGTLVAPQAATATVGEAGPAPGAGPAAAAPSVVPVAVRTADAGLPVVRLLLLLVLALLLVLVLLRRRAVVRARARRRRAARLAAVAGPAPAARRAVRPTPLR